MVFAAGMTATVRAIIEWGSGTVPRRGGGWLLMLSACAVAAVYTSVATPANTPTWRAVPTLYQLRTVVRSEADPGRGALGDDRPHDPIDIRCVEALRAVTGGRRGE